MADEDQGNGGPSLELPSLGFGRRRRKKPTTPAPEATPQAGPEAVPEPAPRPVRPPVDEAPTTILEPERRPEPAPAPVVAADPAPEAAPEPGTRKARPPRRTLPAVGGMTAAVITGLLVGVITVGLTWASLHLCEVAKGTSSCGGPGFLLLLAILVAMVFLGSLLLRAWQVPDPGSTSFLAVGLLAVLALLFLVDVLFNWWMIIIIPVFSVLTFALAHWVTTAFVEPADH